MHSTFRFVHAVALALLVYMAGSSLLFAAPPEEYAVELTFRAVPGGKPIQQRAALKAAPDGQGGVIEVRYSVKTGFLKRENRVHTIYVSPKEFATLKANHSLAQNLRRPIKIDYTAGHYYNDGVPSLKIQIPEGGASNQYRNLEDASSDRRSAELKSDISRDLPRRAQTAAVTVPERRSLSLQSTYWRADSGVWILVHVFGEVPSQGGVTAAFVSDIDSVARGKQVGLDTFALNADSIRTEDQLPDGAIRLSAVSANIRASLVESLVGTLPIDARGWSMSREDIITRLARMNADHLKKIGHVAPEMHEEVVQCIRRKLAGQ